MRRILPALLLVAVVAGACSDDESSSGASDTTAPAVESSVAETSVAETSVAETTVAQAGTTAPTELCTALDDLSASIGALADLDLVAQGTDGLQSAATDIRDDLSAVRETAGDGLREQVDAVGTALDTIESDVEAAGTLVDKGEALFGGLAVLQDSLQELLAAPEVTSCG